MAESRPRAPRNDRSGVGALVGAGPSIVGVSGAMRARDVSRPKDDQVAKAENTVVIRRRTLDAPLPPLAGIRAHTPADIPPHPVPADQAPES